MKLPVGFQGAGRCETGFPGPVVGLRSMRIAITIFRGPENGFERRGLTLPPPSRLLNSGTPGIRFPLCSIIEMAARFLRPGVRLPGAQWLRLWPMRVGITIFGGPENGVGLPQHRFPLPPPSQPRLEIFRHSLMSSSPSNWWLSR